MLTRGRFQKVAKKVWEFIRGVSTYCEPLFSGLDIAEQAYVEAAVASAAVDELVDLMMLLDQVDKRDLEVSKLVETAIPNGVVGFGEVDVLLDRFDEHHLCLAGLPADRGDLLPHPRRDLGVVALAVDPNVQVLFAILDGQHAGLVLLDLVHCSSGSRGTTVNSIFTKMLCEDCSE